MYFEAPQVIGKEWVDELRELAAPLRGARVAHINVTPYRGWLKAKPTPSGPPVRAGPPRAGRIIARRVLGGLHHDYE